MTVKKTTSVSVIHVAEVEAEKTTWSLPSSNDSDTNVPLVKQDKESSVGSAILQLAVSTVCGIFFGIAMEKSRGLYYFLLIWGQWRIKGLEFEPTPFEGNLCAFFFGKN